MARAWALAARTVAREASLLCRHVRLRVLLMLLMLLLVLERVRRALRAPGLRREQLLRVLGHLTWAIGRLLLAGTLLHVGESVARVLPRRPLHRSSVRMRGRHLGRLTCALVLRGQRQLRR